MSGLGLSEPLLEARGISRAVPGGTGWLLQDVSVRLHAGERLALVGPSGSGKTLLLRSLAFLDPLDGGAVYWHGRPVASGSVPFYRQHVIYLHQRPALFEGDVEANLRLPFTLKTHRQRRFDRQRILGLLGHLGRDASFLAKSQRDLSGGEGQIVALLRAIQLDPVVLLLDEPTAALDLSAAQIIETLVSGWLAELVSRALVWVSHDPAQAERMADRRVYLSGGRLQGERLNMGGATGVSSYVSLTYWQVALAASLILINAAVSLLLRLGLARQLLWAAARMVAQLALVGQVLLLVFQAEDWRLVLLMMLVMVVVAGTAAVSRTNRRYSGIWLDSLLAVWVSSWSIAVIAVIGIMHVRPWYQPQYTVPLLGMILGNSLNGVSLGLDRFNEELSVQRARVEALLTLGATRWEAARLPLQQAVRTGTIPIINSMVVAGIVSLPGMMTGQLLAGVDPLEAVKYQMVIMFAIASASCLATMGVVLLCYRRLFNSAHQFLYWRITDQKR